MNNLEHLSDEARRLLSELGWPERFPAEFVPARSIETHISLVLVGGEFVLKLKKRVRFPFLDNSTLERRRENAIREVMLNRRFSRNIYLGLLPLVAEGERLNLDGLCRFPDTTKPLPAGELGVVMRRIDETDLLDDRVARHVENLENDLVEVADLLSSFHKKAMTASTARGARAHNPAQSVRENIEALLHGDPSGTLRSLVSLQAVERYSEQFLREQESLFLERSARGFVVDGHGDLRCDHVVLEETGVSLIDCLEFSEELRTVDVVSDLAFLLSDLPFRGRADLACLLNAAYEERFPEAAHGALLRFYLVYRYMVRAKVELLTLHQHEDDRALADAAGGRLKQYLALAYREALAFPPSFIIVVFGKMGVGKSTLAEALSERLGVSPLQTDVIRNDIREGTVPKYSDSFASGAYTDAAKNKVYDELFRRAEQTLAHGAGVLLDASFSNRRWRDRARDIAEGHQAVLVFFYCTLSEAQQRERLRTRRREGDSPSEGRESLMMLQAEAFEEPNDKDDVVFLDLSLDSETLVRLVIETMCGGKSGAADVTA